MYILYLYTYICKYMCIYIHTYMRTYNIPKYHSCANVCICTVRTNQLWGKTKHIDACLCVCCLCNPKSRYLILPHRLALGLSCNQQTSNVYPVVNQHWCGIYIGFPKKIIYICKSSTSILVYSRVGVIVSIRVFTVWRTPKSLNMCHCS